MRLRFPGEDNKAAPPVPFDTETNTTPLRNDYKNLRVGPHIPIEIPNLRYIERITSEATLGNQKYKRQLPRVGARTAVLDPRSLEIEEGESH